MSVVEAAVWDVSVMGVTVWDVYVMGVTVWDVSVVGVTVWEVSVVEVTVWDVSVVEATVWGVSVVEVTVWDVPVAATMAGVVSIPNDPDVELARLESLLVCVKPDVLRLVTASRVDSVTPTGTEVEEVGCPMSVEAASAAGDVTLVPSSAAVVTLVTPVDSPSGEVVGIVAFDEDVSTPGTDSSVTDDVTLEVVSETPFVEVDVSVSATWSSGSKPEGGASVFMPTITEVVEVDGCVFDVLPSSEMVFSGVHC